MVDRFDAHGAGIIGAAEMNRLAIQQDFAVVGGDRARQRLDQGGFASPVVTDHGADLARHQLKVSTVHGHHGAIALHQPARFKDGFDVGHCVALRSH